MNIAEAKSQIIELLEAQLNSDGFFKIIDPNSPDPKDNGKFVIDGKPARVIHRFNGWNVPINLSWFSGSSDQPKIKGNEFYWYAFAIPKYSGFIEKHYYICDYLTLRKYVLDFDSSGGDDYKNNSYWRADIQLYKEGSNESLGYFRWGDEDIEDQKRETRIIKLDNVENVLKIPSQYKKLEKHADYSREEVHNMFSPQTSFTPQAGRWGLQGIVPITDHQGDYVFFVTIGKQQGNHKFDEGITTDGVLTWQSQPKQSLQDKQIYEFIYHDELRNNIYLFLRTQKYRDYTYMGKLKYLSHDKERECPVYFQWQILDWAPGDTPERIGLQLQNTNQNLAITFTQSKNILQILEPPHLYGKLGISTRSFRSRKEADYSEKEARNRELGLLGEKLVFRNEEEVLISCGKSELAEKIRHLSDIMGDGAGYDIESYTPEGEIKYIEVKTTKGAITSSFFMSSNEKAFAEVNKDKYYLYRVYEYNEEINSGKCFILHGDIEEKLDFSPTQYRVSISRYQG
jgi:hypothetical protein